MRLARAYDEDDRHLRRLATAIAKVHVRKRFPGVAAEALEVLGGNGYVEESGMPRIYREAHGPRAAGLPAGAPRPGRGGGGGLARRGA
jgi:alkylation response protein AidB-like acyl-CoA dehydrogenase